MALPSLSQIWHFARRIDDLFKLQEKTEETVGQMDERVEALESTLDRRLRAIEDRLTKLEAEQTQVISEARGAATAAATLIASSVISDAVTRVTRVEEALKRIERTPLLGGPNRALPDGTATDSR
jgi:hypothetical protein